MKKQILHTFFNDMKNSTFAVEYWDGEVRNYGKGESSDLKIIFKKPLPLTFEIADPMLSIGEAYMDDVIDFQGNFDEVMKMAMKNKDLVKGESNILKVTSKLIKKSNIKKVQKENIHQHYDLGNDFFSLWLDDTMSYSCGYFKESTDTLKDAQINKIDHILKKLQLKPGETLLDIGSGWGWLIIRAAQMYGVKATGITISEEQYKGTLERIKSLGLEDQVEVKLLDYLDLDGRVAKYDKIVSVGMFEHVGRDNLHQYMEKVQELLEPKGLSLLHSIMGTHEDDVNSWIAKYIFPGGYVPSLRETTGLLPEYDFHLIHAETLRMHYAMTLDRWYENYRQHWGVVEEKYGRRFARMWELYLKGCASNFRVSGLDIYQLLFSKGLNNDLPLTLHRI
ncbi:SAM-dependent methyltransferase [Parasporobacterium paucivorans]|nr:cyclopropane-fatty-acyl-phospholipid synthase family protein [Parasporobacterium paucivorans]